MEILSLALLLQLAGVGEVHKCLGEVTRTNFLYPKPTATLDWKGKKMYF